MALQFAHGAVQWLSSSAVATDYVVTGLGFQPKALRFYWTGLQNAADDVSSTTSSVRGVGFATSTSDRRCLSTADLAAVATSFCGSAVVADAVAVVPITPSTDGKLDLGAIGADGFTLTVDVQAALGLTVFWEAWGGDVMTAMTGELSEPAATGTQNYTATGFTAIGTDQVVMFAACHQTAATPSGGRSSSGIAYGAATSASAQVVHGGGADDNVATMSTGGYDHAGECVAMVSGSAGGAVSARAALSAFGTDLFTLNWISRATTGRKVIYLAIKGGQWRAGSTTINLNAANTATVSGLPFRPGGLSVLWSTDPEDAAGVGHAADVVSVGSGTSASSRRSQGAISFDATADSTVFLTLEYDQVASPGNAFTLDISTLNSDGFTLVNDGSTAAISASWVGYLAFGNIPGDEWMVPTGYRLERVRNIAY